MTSGVYPEQISTTQTKDLQAISLSFPNLSPACHFPPEGGAPEENRTMGKEINHLTGSLPHYVLFLLN